MTVLTNMALYTPPLALSSMGMVQEQWGELSPMHAFLNNIRMISVGHTRIQYGIATSADLPGSMLTGWCGYVGPKTNGAQHGPATARDKAMPQHQAMSKLDEKHFRMHLRLQAGHPSVQNSSSSTNGQILLPCQRCEVCISVTPASGLHWTLGDYLEGLLKDDFPVLSGCRNIWMS